MDDARNNRDSASPSARKRGTTPISQIIGLIIGLISGWTAYVTIASLL